MDQVSIAIAGFAVVSVVLLFFAYAVFVNVSGKSVYSIGWCAALVAVLVAIQNGHLLYLVALVAHVRLVGSPAARCSTRVRTAFPDCDDSGRVAEPARDRGFVAAANRYLQVVG